MVIWKGFGLAVVVIAMATFVGVEWALEAAFEDPRYYQDNAWAPIFAGVLAAVFLWLFSSWLDHYRVSGQVDEETGKPLRAPDSLLFVPVRFWVWIVPVIAVVAGMAPK